jgi:hypothetical protein
MKIMKIISFIIGTIITVDVFGFMMWIIAGQFPVGDLYAGILTAHVLRILL